MKKILCSGLKKKSPVETTAAIINNVPDKTRQRDQKYLRAFMLSH